MTPEQEKRERYLYDAMMAAQVDVENAQHDVEAAKKVKDELLEKAHTAQEVWLDAGGCGLLEPLGGLEVPNEMLDVPRGTLDDVSQHETMQDKVVHAAECAAAVFARAANSREVAQRATVAADNAWGTANLEAQEVKEAEARLVELQKQMMDDAEAQGQEAEHDALAENRKVGPWLTVCVCGGEYYTPYVYKGWASVENMCRITSERTKGEGCVFICPVRWITAVSEVLTELGQCHALLRELEPKAVEDGIVYRQIRERADAVGVVIAKCRAPVDTSHAMDAVEYSKGPEGG